jgi:hypothetical protein
MDWLGLVQWPAMGTSVVAAWLVASRSQRRRGAGFWWFLAGNALWIIWGFHMRAWGLVALQIVLVGLNVRGARKNETPRGNR